MVGKTAENSARAVAVERIAENSARAVAVVGSGEDTEKGQETVLSWLQMEKGCFADGHHSTKHFDRIVGSDAVRLQAVLE